MASLEYLREEMARAAEIMDDTSKPFDVRRAARSRFWHCEKRVGTMERGGLTDDEPGTFMLGYSEIGIADRPSKLAAVEAPTVDPRRDLIDRRTAAHFASKERL